MEKGKSDASNNQGFDEFMNLVLEDGEEVDTKNNTRVKIGKFFDLIENIMQKERASAKNAVVKQVDLC